MSVEVYDFRSDNVGGVAPELLEALQAANRGTAAPYGDDDFTHAMTTRFRHAFEHDGLLAFPLATGTGANAVALASEKRCRYWVFETSLSAVPVRLS